MIFVIGDNGGSGEGTLQGVFDDMNIVSQSTETLDYLEANMDDMGGWKPFRLPWSGVGGTDVEVMATEWELYNIDEDFPQARNLAAEMPEKLREMQLRFYAEAAKNNVLPIQTSAAERFGEGIRPSLVGDRTSCTYTAGLQRIPEGAAPPIKNRTWSLTADVTLTEGDSGVIATEGGILAGWALYFDAGKPVFSYSFTHGERWRIAADEPLPAGEHKLVMTFTYDGDGMGKGGDVTIAANDKVVAQGRVERTVPFRFSTEETFDVGEDTGTPVDLSYDTPAVFTGELGNVVIDLK